VYRTNVRLRDAAPSGAKANSRGRKPPGRTPARPKPQRGEREHAARSVAPPGLSVLLESNRGLTPPAIGRRPSGADTRYPPPATPYPTPDTRLRRGSALAEFVLFLPFVLFIILVIFHFGVSTLRKQRTLVAARFGADAVAREIGFSLESEFWTHPISGNQYPRRQAYPDPHDHYLGLFKTDYVQLRFLSRLHKEDVTIEATTPDDGVQRLKGEIESRDAADPPVTQVTRTFWEQPFAATEQIRGDDLDFAWHVYAHGARVGAAYRPQARYLERVQGPIRSHFYRESASWAFPYPDMWWELGHSDSGFAELQDALYGLSRNPVMGRTGEAFLRWFEH